MLGQSQPLKAGSEFQPGLYFWTYDFENRFRFFVVFAVCSLDEDKLLSVVFILSVI